MLYNKDDPARMFELSAGIHLRSRRAAERALKPHGLTYAQYGGLLALSKGGAMSQSALASALETDTTTAMVVRGSLERKGLVERKSDPADGRIKILSLTAKGRKLAEAAARDVNAFYLKLSALVSSVDTKKLLPILEKLHELSTAAAEEAAAVGAAKKAPKARKPQAKPAKKAAPTKRVAAKKAAAVRKVSAKKAPAAAKKAPAKAAAKRGAKQRRS
jgi:MarR family transcriptional regulator, organic hydroperoxide resistance regulator